MTFIHHLERNRPKMNLIGQDGNIFGILGKAARLLRENGQPDQATEMTNRVFHSSSYEAALESSASMWKQSCRKKPAKSNKERGNER